MVSSQSCPNLSPLRSASLSSAALAAAAAGFFLKLMNRSPSKRYSPDHEASQRYPSASCIIFSTLVVGIPFLSR